MGPNGVVLVSPSFGHHLKKAPTHAISFGQRRCSLKENEETLVTYVLTQTQGDRKETARVLGVTVRQVQRKLPQTKKDPKWEAQLVDL